DQSIESRNESVRRSRTARGRPRAVSLSRRAGRQPPVFFDSRGLTPPARREAWTLASDPPFLYTSYEPSSVARTGPAMTCLDRRAASLLLLVVLAAPAGAAPPSFRNEVMAVLSRAGCNQGTCHGNQNGKNGFKLSLRGDDPARDLTALTRDMLARRSNT